MGDAIMSRHDSELQNLLSLDGEIFPMESGFWTKFEVREVVSDERFPHGIRYSLTLHDGSNRRVLGFDNAHGYRPKRKRFAGGKTTWDHIHLKERVVPYEFESPGTLLEDFWREVGKIAGE